MSIRFAALALALLIASAKTTYENANAELRTSMARLVLLDRVMARYGVRHGRSPRPLAHPR